MKKEDENRENNRNDQEEQEKTPSDSGESIEWEAELNEKANCARMEARKAIEACVTEMTRVLRRSLETQLKAQEDRIARSVSGAVDPQKESLRRMFESGTKSLAIDSEDLGIPAFHIAASPSHNYTPPQAGPTGREALSEEMAALRTEIQALRNEIRDMRISGKGS